MLVNNSNKIKAKVLLIVNSLAFTYLGQAPKICSWFYIREIFLMPRHTKYDTEYKTPSARYHTTQHHLHKSHIKQISRH